MKIYSFTCQLNIEYNKAFYEVFIDKHVDEKGVHYRIRRVLGKTIPEPDLQLRILKAVKKRVNIL